MSSAASEARTKRIGIVQSNYVPWKGYFDFIAACDEFVLLDEVQYTRRDWRNRNRIKTKAGLQWLTIPVEVKGKYRQRIDEVRVSDPSWTAEHLRALRLAYARAPHFAETWELVERAYTAVAAESSLSSINERLIRSIADTLEIATPIRRSDELRAEPGRNERLISICEQLGATEYLSGPSAQAYIDDELWQARGIRVRYKSYAGYPEYAQLHPPFEHAVTILDLLFNVGPSASKLFRAADRLELARA